MQRKPCNARTDRLTDWRFFFHIYLVGFMTWVTQTCLCTFAQFYGLVLWPCAMTMWFLYMNQQDLSFYKVILTFNQWQDGWQGYTLGQLNQFVDVGQGI
jgi:sodium/potassium-transporting ATPase subunit alpha